MNPETQLDADPKNWKFPVLGGITQPGFHIHAVRELTDVEKEKLPIYSKASAEARNRFKLFTILARNYAEWWNFTRSLLTPGEDLDLDEKLELDRLLSNLLASAKALLDQFNKEWEDAFEDPAKKQQFKAFIQKLEKGSWAFAFFQDFRNFTQHHGLPVGSYSRNATATSVNLSVEADSAWLVGKYAKWKKSGLKADCGKLDLIELTQEYNVRLHQDFGNFVAQEFAPGLLEAHHFYAGLANEVAELHPGAQFKIITELTIDNGKLHFEFSTPPPDLMKWIGISVRERQKK